MLNHFRQGKIGRFRVKVTLDDLEVRRSRSEEVVGFLVRDIAETEDLADFARGE
jgi:hypothetical protein